MTRPRGAEPRRRPAAARRRSAPDCLAPAWMRLRLGCSTSAISLMCMFTWPAPIWDPDGGSRV
eukprot:7116392-Prymnesium_polylepis.1